MGSFERVCVFGSYKLDSLFIVYAYWSWAELVHGVVHGEMIYKYMRIESVRKCIAICETYLLLKMNIFSIISNSLIRISLHIYLNVAVHYPRQNVWAHAHFPLPFDVLAIGISLDSMAMRFAHWGMNYRNITVSFRWSRECGCVLLCTEIGDLLLVLLSKTTQISNVQSIVNRSKNQIQRKLTKEPIAHTLPHTQTGSERENSWQSKCYVTHITIIESISRINNVNVRSEFLDISQLANHTFASNAASQHTINEIASKKMPPRNRSSFFRFHLYCHPCT